MYHQAMTDRDMITTPPTLSNNSNKVKLDVQCHGSGPLSNYPTEDKTSNQLKKPH